MWHQQSFVSKATQKERRRRDQQRHLESELRTSEKRDKLKDRERDQNKGSEQKIKSRRGIRATKEDRNTKNE